MHPSTALVRRAKTAESALEQKSILPSFSSLSLPLAGFNPYDSLQRQYSGLNFACMSAKSLRLSLAIFQVLS